MCSVSSREGADSSCLLMRSRYQVDDLASDHGELDLHVEKIAGVDREDVVRQHDQVCEQPRHPYTELLLASIPDPDPLVQPAKSRRRRELTVGGELGAAGGAPETGCPFATRCPHVMDVCRTEFPEPLMIEGGGEVRCHLHTSGPSLAGRPLTELEAAAT